MVDLRILLMLMALPVARGAVPGTFFWKPRLGIDLSIPSTEHPFSGVLHAPTAENVRAGLVVFIESYSVGITIMALAVGISDAANQPYLDPTKSAFYINAYRWGLRHISMLPAWAGGISGNYCNTHKVWKRRFYFTDEFPPDWFRYLIPWLTEEDWNNEKELFKKYKKYAEPKFGKHYRYPTKHFNNFKSYETKETYEGDSSLDQPSVSESKPPRFYEP